MHDYVIFSDLLLSKAMQQINKEDTEEMVFAKLIKMEQELREWWCPSLKHLKSLVSIFDGSEHLKSSIPVIDQLFRNFLVIDSKKELLQTLEHWSLYEQFLSVLLECELFQKEFKQDVINTIQNRIYGIQVYINQAKFEGLIASNNVQECEPKALFDSCINAYRELGRVEEPQKLLNSSHKLKTKVIAQTDSDSSDSDINTQISIQK